MERTVSETPCQREGRKTERHHRVLSPVKTHPACLLSELRRAPANHITKDSFLCEGAHNKLVVRLSLLASSSCERLQATWIARQQLIVVTKVCLFPHVRTHNRALDVRALLSEQSRKRETLRISLHFLPALEIDNGHSSGQL